jgi:tetratricopeptide (TPR) repeat protein
MSFLVRFCGFLLLFAALWSCQDAPTPPPGSATTDPELYRLEKLLEKDPNNDSLIYLHGRQLWELEAYDEAMTDALRAIELDSFRPAYYRLLSDVLFDYGRPNDSKRAIDVLDLAIRKFPDDLHNYLKISEMYLIVKQHGNALKSLDKVLQRDAQNADAYFMSGRVALDMGDTTRAIKSLEKSVSIDADNRDAWVFLGRIFSNRGLPTAMQFFDNALRLDSTDVEIMEYKAAHLKRTGQFEQAFGMYRDIIRRHPDYSNAYFDMGLIYLELDSLQKAEDHFDLAIRTDQLFVIAYYYRGYAREVKGNLKGAIEDYQQANRMSPSLPEPKEALARLKVK